MERTVTSDLSLRLRVLAARAHQGVGWAGLAGIGLMLMALAWTVLARLSHSLPLPAEYPTLVQPGSRIETSHAPANDPIRLSQRSELTSILGQIHQVAVSHGLGWPAADYRINAANDTTPANLEVRCRLKGDYLKLRGAMAEMLRSVPGLAIRELTMNRPTIDVIEVDAKLTLVVFLKDEAIVVERTAQPVTP